MFIRCLNVMLFLALAVVASREAAAQDYAVVAPYLNDDVIAVATIDLARINLPVIVDELVKLKLVQAEHEADLKLAVGVIQSHLDELTNLGARRAFVLFRTSDIGAGGPLWVVETASAEQAVAVTDWLKPWLKLPDFRGDVDDLLPKALAPQDKCVLGGPSEERVTTLAALRADKPRPEAVEALAGAGTADAALVLFGDADSRRVIREVFPTLPAPFMEINGALLADGVKSVAATVKLPPDLRVGLAVETSGEQTAATLRQSAEKGITILKGLAMAVAMNPPADLPVSGPQLTKAIDMLTPQVEGSRLSITLGDDAEELAIVQQLVGKPLYQAREAAQRNQRMNQFKQIALGMLNYESSKKTYPAAASYSADGKPLLSWRVHILPYVEQDALYQQFRLDEPWDSDHNRPLISKMPEIYADPDPAVIAAMKAAGRTTYVAPTGEGLIFDGPEGKKITQITDGTSNTILAVEVTPDRAVVWTQPEDWEVDLGNPLEGVKRSDRNGFTAAYCDGHVEFHPNEVDAVEFKKRLTPAGGEVVER